MPVREVSSIAAAFGVVGAVSSQLMNLSAIPSMLQIIRAKSTLLYPPYPFIIGLAASINGLTYCIITGQWVVVISTSFTMSFNLAYLIIHFTFSQKRRAIARLTAISVSAVVVISGSGPLIACLSDSVDSCSSFAVTWLGGVSTVVYCLVYSGQLWTVRQIIKMGNSSPISPWLTAGVTFCAAMWTVYAALVPDFFYLASSVSGDLSALVQIGLLWRYPRLPMEPGNTSPQPPPCMDPPARVELIETKT